MHYSKEDIVRMVEEEDVEFIRLQFTDVYGNLKNMAVTVSQLDRVLDGKVVFDGGAIDGFYGEEAYEMYLYPDLDTFVIFPWRPQQGKVARFLCEVQLADGTSYEGDSRNILKNTLALAAAEGYQLKVATKLEFFLMELDEKGNPMIRGKEKGGYFDVGPLDAGENARREMVMTLEDMGFVVEASHHEAAPSQHEIDLAFTDALTAADNIVTFKMAIRTIARRHGLHATFMPKPNAGVFGSGLHLKFALFRDMKNVFMDENEPNGLSSTANGFIAGLLNYSHETALFLNPLVNSYKRLVSGGNAPVFEEWSVSGRDTILNIPMERGARTGIELKSPDPSANPYLTLALCLTAGLEGVRKGLRAKEREYNVLRQESKRLPNNLLEAIVAAEDSELLRSVLGVSFLNSYVQAKRREWDAYSEEVSEWERQQYLIQY